MTIWPPRSPTRTSDPLSPSLRRFRSRYIPLYKSAYFVWQIFLNDTPFYMTYSYLFLVVDNNVKQRPPTAFVLITCYIWNKWLAKLTIPCNVGAISLNYHCPVNLGSPSILKLFKNHVIFDDFVFLSPRLLLRITFGTCLPQTLLCFIYSKPC